MNTNAKTIETVPNHKKHINAAGRTVINTHWSRLGTDISTATSVEEALRQSHLNWNASLQDVYLPGKNEVDGIKVIGKHVPGISAVVRDDTQDVLGTVGRGYNVLDNHEVFSIFDGLIQDGGVHFDRAGAMQSNHYGVGSRIFIAGTLPTTFEVGPDEVQTFLYGKSGHDGGQSLVFTVLGYCLICSNGMMGMRNSNSIKIRHTKNAKDRFEQARELLGFAQTHQIWLNNIANQLFNTPMDTSEMTHFIEELLPATTNGKGETKVSGRNKNKREAIEKLFTTGIGQKERGLTRWAAFNAVTEYVDHHQKFSSRLKDDVTARHDSGLEGSVAGIKDRALELLSV